MKLEVGQFVRTDNGIIGKIYEKIGDMFTYKDSNRDYITYGLLHTEIKKASYNIIDILEVGDYVNGCYVSNKRASVNEHLGGHPKGIGIIKCNAYFNQGNYNDCKFEWIEEKDIKSVITHEQMEQIAYKVEE